MVVVQILLAALVLLATPPARAASKESQERAARKACLSGDYTKGVEILSDLFIDSRDPTYIFNQARCFEQNSRWEEAISRFREYLRKATSISAAERADTEKHITDCEALRDAKGTPDASHDGASALPNPTAAPALVPATTSAAPTPTPASSSVTPVPEQTTVVGASPLNPGSGLRIAGITCGAIGVASIGTAIYYYTQAKSYSDKVSKETIPIAADEQAGKRAQTMQWVFYSVGAAAIATGTVLYVLGWTSADVGRAAGVVPMVAPGLAGISAQGVF